MCGLTAAIVEPELGGALTFSAGSTVADASPLDKPSGPHRAALKPFTRGVGTLETANSDHSPESISTCKKVAATATST